LDLKGSIRADVLAASIADLMAWPLRIAETRGLRSLVLDSAEPMAGA